MTHDKVIAIYVLFSTIQYSITSPRLNKSFGTGELLISLQIYNLLLLAFGFALTYLIFLFF